MSSSPASPALPAVRRDAVLPRAALGRLAYGLAPWLLPVGLLWLWQTGASQGWISPQVLPSPQFVYETLAELATSGELWLNVEASLRRVVLGFAVGSALGLLLGWAMACSRTVETYVLPTFNALVQIPVLGWMPFVLLVFGIGEPLKYILIAKAALVPVTLNTLQGLRDVPVSYREAARAFGYTPRQELFEVRLPLAAPTIFTGLRLGFTKAWLSLVVVELVASSEGLGYLIVYGRQLFQLDLVMAAVVVVGAIGYAIDKLLDLAESRLIGRGRAAAVGAV
ncbi:ABC transporter permease [Verticiella sediminum]|uniref:ABC transporter permease n=1 Tax=Verticiella sediminum TaxID=1247510 RepID=A0A556A5T2_9BURK|nr:ABC transporter permease [Verticiella sediminum]TSH88251.1 ABC transporter permease [Verticiella sediminum]